MIKVMEKVALVTGSSSGIGFETSLALARKGYYTFASMRNLEKSDKIQDVSKKENLNIEVIKLDVDNEDSVKSAIQDIISKKGRIDVLVNNAGYMLFGAIEDLSIDGLRKQFETNFFSIVRIIQEVAPFMRKQKDGIIVNISSVVGRLGLPGTSAYISTKFALEGLSECMRYELSPHGVKTIIIEPGAIKSNFLSGLGNAKCTCLGSGNVYTNLGSSTGAVRTC